MFGLPQSLYLLTLRDQGSPLVLPQFLSPSGTASAASVASFNAAVPADQVFVCQQVHMSFASSVSTERITSARVGVIAAGGGDLGSLIRFVGSAAAPLVSQGSIAAQATFVWNQATNLILPANCSINVQGEKDAAVGNFTAIARLWGWMIPASIFGRL